jgi:hypothetical protein
MPTSVTASTDHEHLLLPEENRRHLIVGGDAFAPPFHSYPWFVKVLGKNRAGVLVAPQFFITKASYAKTIVAPESSSVVSRIGYFCNQEEDNCGQYYEDRMVQNVFIHPEYHEMGGGPNLMLVQLNDTSTITPLKMDHGRLALSYQSGMCSV